VPTPHGADAVPAAVTTDAFVTPDGLRLPLRRWTAEEPKAILIALHGMSDYSRAFTMPGPWLAERGITVLAYDQRSFGAGPERGHWPGGDALRADLAAFVSVVRHNHPGVPVFVLGESMGGAVVLTALADGQLKGVTGIVLVAPAVWSRSDMPLSYRVALWLAAHTVPWLELSGSGLKIWPSDNIEMLRELSRDPLFQHETRADAVWGLVNLMDAARMAPARLTDPPPILFLYGAKDQIIPAAPTEAVIAALGKRAEVHRYPNGYHMLLRDLDRETVWKDLAHWIGDHAATKTAAVPAQ